MSTLRSRHRHSRLRTRWPTRTILSWAIAAVVPLAIVLGAKVALTPQAGSGGSQSNVTLIVARQVTAEEAAASTPPDLLARAEDLAVSGENRLVIIQAAGDGGRQAGPAVPLRIEREPGHLDTDRDSRRVGIATLVASAIEAADAMPSTGGGRDLAGLLTAISAVRGPGRNEVWLSTLGLGTLAPADTRQLTAADPGQAAASVAAALPAGALDRTTIRLVLTAPAGAQPWLAPRTAAWRTSFIVTLLRALGAEIESVREDLVPRPSLAGAPTAPVVANLPEATPQPVPLPARPDEPISIPLDSATLFEPDTAAFTGGEAAAAMQLAPLLRAIGTSRYRIEVVGRCARFGPPASARLLSAKRAVAVADLLRRSGVKVDEVRGLGFDDPLPPDPQAAANRSVTVLAHIAE